MTSPKNLLLAVLTVTTLGGALLAWRQYGELVELRASAMNRDERADLQKRIWDLEKLNRELQNRPGNVRRFEGDANSADAEAEDGLVARAPREERGRERRGGDPRQQMNAVRELMAKPEVQAMLNVQQKAAISARYAALFRNLNLTPDQADRVTALLAERGTTRLDVMTAAREQGIDPRDNPEAFRKLMSDAQAELNSSLKSVLGDTGFTQLQTYEQTLPQRAFVENLQQRLSYSSTPLTPAQAEQLVQILAANPPPRTSTAPATPGAPDVVVGGADGVRFLAGPGPGGRGPDVGGMLAGVLGGPGPGVMLDGGRGVTVTPNAVAQAQTVLAPTQLAALQSIQQQQETQQKLQQMVRETLSGGQGAAGQTGAAPAGGGPRRGGKGG